jgi:hypothetical protein
MNLVLVRSRSVPGVRGDYFALWGPWGASRLMARSGATTRRSLYEEGVVIETPPAMRILLDRIRQVVDDGFARAPTAEPGMTPSVEVSSPATGAMPAPDR